MESQDELLRKVNVCMSRNIPKLAIAMLVIGIITIVIVSLFMAPIAASIMAGSTNPGSLIVFLFLSILVYAIDYVLLYGFFILVMRLYLGQHAVLGHIFAGFRDFKRAFIVGIFFTITLVIAMIFFAFLTSLGMAPALVGEVDENAYQSTMLLTLGIVLIFMLVVFAVLHIRYGFVWFLLYEQPELNVRDALKQSAVLTKGNRLNFVLFCLKSAGIYLLVYVLSLIAPFILPQSTIVGMANFLCLYAVLIRICIAFAAWHTTLRVDSKTTEHSIPSTVIELPDATKTDSSNSTENTEE